MARRPLYHVHFSPTLVSRINQVERWFAEMIRMRIQRSVIVGAYVGHHTVATTDLPALIATVGQQLAGLNQVPAEPEEEKPASAVPIKRSVTPDHIICLDHGGVPGTDFLHHSMGHAQDQRLSSAAMACWKT